MGQAIPRAKTQATSDTPIPLTNTINRLSLLFSSSNLKRRRAAAASLRSRGGEDGRSVSEVKGSILGRSLWFFFLARGELQGYLTREHRF